MPNRTTIYIELSIEDLAILSQENLQEIESLLFSSLVLPQNASAHAVFICGAPRTGSTILYQLLIAGFSLSFFSNLTNRFFFQAPIVGLAIEAGARGRMPVEFSSAFGKTQGELQPSEASRIMRNWFGGGHPSQTVSATVMPGKTIHLQRTLSSAEILYSAPLVIKNAWNCFRIDAIAEALPAARFLWIQRDIRSAAKSDLYARYAVQGSPTIWNSATPSNYQELLERPYWEQVVENQFEFNRAINSGLIASARDRFTHIWYEDLCRYPMKTLSAVGRGLGLSNFAMNEAAIKKAFTTSTETRLPGDDSIRIDSYVAANETRLLNMLYFGDTQA